MTWLQLPGDLAPWMNIADMDSVLFVAAYGAMCYFPNMFASAMPIMLCCCASQAHAACCRQN